MIEAIEQDIKDARAELEVLRRELRYLVMRSENMSKDIKDREDLVVKLTDLLMEKVAVS